MDWDRHEGWAWDSSLRNGGEEVFRTPQAGVAAGKSPVKTNGFQATGENWRSNGSIVEVWSKAIWKSIIILGYFCDYE